MSKMRRRAAGALGRAQGVRTPTLLPAEPAALSAAEEEHVVDVLCALSVLDDRQLAALVGLPRAAELRAMQRDVLRSVASATMY